MKYSVIATWLFIPTLLLFSAEVFSIDLAEAQTFHQKFNRALADRAVPGGAFVIVKNMRTLAMGTYGKREKGGNEQIDFSTTFRLASVSKTFAGTLGSLLEQENKFNWQDPVVDHIPSFTLADEQAAKEINLGHIIGQSSGLMPNSYDNILNANRKLDTIWPQFSKLSPMCAPGKCYSYQNIAFSLIQPVIEKQTGTSYSQLVNDRLFTPLRMNNASVGMQALLSNPNHASPHVKTRSGFKQVRVKPNYYQVEPAAGINASITDIEKWLKASMGYAPSIIPASVIHDITTPGVRTRQELRRRGWKQYLNNAHYGKGWRIYDFNGETLIYHAGWVQGYVAEIAYAPKQQIGLAMLLNGESRIITELSADFWSEILTQ